MVRVVSTNKRLSPAALGALLDRLEQSFAVTLTLRGLGHGQAGHLANAFLRARRTGLRNRR